MSDPIEQHQLLQAADLHNIGAGTTSFFDDPAQYVGDKAQAVGDFVTSIPAFAAASVVSGTNSLYNSGVAAGNFFGVTDASQQDTQELMNSLDSNLGEYYGEHKQLADTAGFLATSFVPGIAGVKLLNAGQKVLGLARVGAVGETMAEATGLAVTTTQAGKTLATLAGEGLAAGQQTFTLMNAGVLKAIAGGVGQATLDSFAFEAMVQATMFKSPVLEGQDFKDIASNIALGTILGGVIGGAINSAHVYGEVKRVLTATDQETAHIRLRGSQAGLENDPAARIVVGADDMSTTPISANASEQKLIEARVAAIKLEQRSAIHQLAGSDNELAAHLADMAETMQPDDISAAFGKAKSVSRAGENGVTKPTANEIAGYVVMHGEGAGETTFTSLPRSQLTLADKMVGKEAIDAYVGRQGFRSSVPFDATKVVSADQMEARYMWAETQARFEEGMKIHESDIPMLEGASRNNIGSVQIVHPDGGITQISALDDLAVQLASSKQKYILDIGKANPTWSTSEVARAANVTVKAIESDGAASMYARQDARKEYEAAMQTAGIKKSGDELSYIPKHAAVKYDGLGYGTVNGDTASAMTIVKYKQKVQMQSVDNVVANIVGDDAERLVRPGDKAMLGANRFGAGAGLFTFANGSFGTLASWAENVGAVASDLSKKLRKATSASMDSPLLSLRTNQVAAIEFDKINNLLASTTEKYVLDDSGKMLISQKIKQFNDATSAERKNVEQYVLQAGAPETVPISSVETLNAIKAHMEANGARVSQGKSLKNAMGLEDVKDPSTFYPIKPQPRDMPYFAFVKDESVTGAGMGHTSMIHANSANELDAMIKLAREKTGYKVYTKGDTEAFFKAQKEYEFDRTLHDNYMDGSLKSAGVNNQFFPKTDPDKIADYIQQFHARGDDMLAREVIATKFAHEFDQLETLGQQYTNVAGSRYATSQNAIENTAQNPYNDYRKTALNISRLGEYPIVSSINKTLSSAVDGVYNSVSKVWDQAKSVNDLESVNSALRAAGVDHAYKNAAEIILANHTAPKPVLSQFIRNANSILANTFLKLDPLNGLNNAIGAQVLLGTETSSQVRNIVRDAAGVTVPGTTDKILSTTKLLGDAQKSWFDVMKGTPEGLALKERFQKNGWMKTMNDQQRDMLDSLALQGSETPVQLQGKIAAAFERAKELTAKGEVVTGNRFFEDYNRFAAAKVADDLYTHQVTAGLAGEDGRNAYISTFVNRTQGNTLASQRPLIFQGPIGQAIGLFQTFQFNTLQQLFRHVAEGEGKDAAMMMGLQGTMYGMNGLPGFQYINQHIIGTASGNPNHTDAYSNLYGAAGKTAGDWLMYGIPSNLLQTNLYSRGDINPRTLTVVPIAPQDLVTVSAFGKFAGNLKETVGKLAGGGDVWQSVLQGLEHNGISRPLAGLAQTLQAADGGKVYSTTNKGDVSFVNDFMSLATLSRLSGGKPMDEQLANDEISRAMAYKASDKLRMSAATETFKTSVIGAKGGSVDPLAVQDYMAAFVHNGGRQQDFNASMTHTLMTVNTAAANKVITNLKGPYADHMKSLMNGKVTDLGQE